MRKTIFLLVVFGMATLASADVIFQDNFEGVTANSDAWNVDTGDYDPVAQVGSWGVYEAQGATPKPYYIQTTSYGTPGPAPGSSQYVQILNTWNTHYLEGNFASATSNDVTMSLWFYGDGADDGRIAITGSDNKTSVFVLLGESTGGGSGTIGVRVTPSTWGSVGSYTSGWNKLTIETDISAGTYAVSLNDGTPGTAYFYHADASDFAYTRIESWNGNFAQFDDVEVSAVPEPTTMALVGLGALLLPRKRKA